MVNGVTIAVSLDADADADADVDTLASRNSAPVIVFPDFIFRVFSVFMTFASQRFTVSVEAETISCLVVNYSNSTLAVGQARRISRKAENISAMRYEFL